MPQIFGKVSRALPAYSSDGTQVQQRVTGYGDIVTTQLGDNHSSLADEGSYFKATNASIGVATAISTVPTSYTAASPMFMIVNNAASASGKRIFVDYVRLFVSSIAGTNASAASQSIQCAVVLDDNTVGSGRYSSGGSAGAISVVNVNSGSSVGSSASVYFGASLTASSVGNPRQIIRSVFKTHSSAPGTNLPPVIVGDSYSMDFGEHSAGSGALNGFLASAYAASVGPAVIGPSHCLLFYMWYPATTGILPSYEFEIGWWER